MKKSYLLRRPNSDDEEDYTLKETVQVKPIKECYSKILGSSFENKNFVKGSEKSQREFYGTQTIMNSNSKNESFACLNTSKNENTISLLTHNEQNKINAKIIKAELKGDKELAQRLKKKLEQDVRVNKNLNLEKEKTNILLKINKKNGLVEPSNSANKFCENQNCSKFVDKQFYQDLELSEIIALEKKTSSHDQLTMFNRSAKMCSVNKTDNDWIVDDSIMSYSSKKRHIKEDEQNAMKKKIKDHIFLEKTLNSCKFCINSQLLAKHSIVSVGSKTYLAVISWDGLSDEHCYIAPMSHYASTVLLDEDVYDELKLWYKSLVTMWNNDKNDNDEGKDCVFFENAKNVSQQTHMYIECVPLPKEAGDLAPIYFKKAILECEKEWSDNQKIIDLSKLDSKKNIKKIIPKGFPYFSINFGLQPGYAHIIENDKLFSINFAHEIIAGMLDLPHNKWRNVSQMSINEIKQKRDNFKKKYEKFDWTTKV